MRAHPFISLFCCHRAEYGRFPTGRIRVSLEHCSFLRISAVISRQRCSFLAQFGRSLDLSCIILEYGYLGDDSLRKLFCC